MFKERAFSSNNEDRKFERDYYRNRDVPLVREKLGAACKSATVEQGIAGPTPGSRPAFIAMGHIYFDSLEAFQTAFGPHAETIMADIPNYTDIQPTLQISEVKI